MLRQQATGSRRRAAAPTDHAHRWAKREELPDSALAAGYLIWAALGTWLSLGAAIWYIVF
jgi:hypothetical protein